MKRRGSTIPPEITREFTCECPICHGDDLAEYLTLPPERRGLRTFADDLGTHYHFVERPPITLSEGQAAVVNARTPARSLPKTGKTNVRTTTRVLAERLGLIDGRGNVIVDAQPAATMLDDLRGPGQPDGAVPDLLGRVVADDELISRVVDPATKKADLQWETPPWRRRGPKRDHLVDSESFNRLYDALLPRVQEILRRRRRVRKKKGEIPRSAIAREIEKSMRINEPARRRPLPEMPKVLLPDGELETRDTREQEITLYTTNLWLVQRVLAEMDALGPDTPERPAEAVTSLIARKLHFRRRGKDLGEYEPSSTTPVRVVRSRRRIKTPRIL